MDIKADKPTDRAVETPLMAWLDYISPPGQAARYGKNHRHNLPAFAGQREILRQVIQATHPASIACLGAGALNDVPYRMLVRDGVKIHLADWQAEAMEAGVAHTISRVRADGPPACLYCALEDRAAGAYCRNFKLPRDAEKRRCAGFQPAPDDAERCATFIRGDEPRLHGEDVTAGYASSFAARLGDILPGARSWRQALAQARTLAREVRKQSAPLGIASGSIDLATSAMVLSQFEHEPYAYFSRQTQRLLGDPSKAENQKLKASLELLRDELLTRQVERHCDEILRILKPGGRCFMSFEMFHFDVAAGRWFLVEQMHRALETIAGRFRFNFDILGEDGSTVMFENKGVRSMVHCYVLESGGG